MVVFLVFDLKEMKMKPLHILSKNSQGNNLKNAYLNIYRTSSERGPFRQRHVSADAALLTKVNAAATCWRNRPDTEGKRVMSKLLSMFDQGDELLLAIIADDLVLLKQLSSDNFSNKPHLFCLEAACFFGAGKIANYLLDEKHNDLSHSPNLLGYALSSGDSDFALEFASNLQKHGYTKPQCLELYSHGLSRTELNAIKTLFAEEGVELYHGNDKSLK